tara:strand:+ start:132 stop:455 length:324 start_codon:yes stop_codon:yes gene_type:complete
MKTTILSYFKKFSNKDIDGLSLLFDESVILKDWEIFAEGKADVLDAISNIFNSVDSISIELDKLYLDEKVSICVIDIVINKLEVLKVVDLIKVNNDNKIIEISAYKQ